MRRGASQRAVARRFGVSLSTVQRCLARAAGARLDRVEWGDRPRTPHHSRRTEPELEDLVLSLRRQLATHSALGEFGALAIHQTLAEQLPTGTVPSVRTIGRILERRGALDGRRRTRRPAPPRGWYLPEVATRRAELDSFDGIEGLHLRGGQVLEVLTGVSLHGGLPAAWPTRLVTSAFTCRVLPQHWRAHGLPAYVQFDNDARFHGSHGYADLVGRVTRLCLSLGVTPVFAPPYETGFQAAVESLNGRWQAKVWSRAFVPSLAQLQQRSLRFIAASRAKLAVRIEAAPARRPFPAGWRFDPRPAASGTIIYLRRTTERGSLRILGHPFSVDRHWGHRLVRAEVDLDRHRVRFFALRRRAPEEQPLLAEASYTPTRRRLVRGERWDTDE